MPEITGKKLDFTDPLQINQAFYEICKAAFTGITFVKNIASLTDHLKRGIAEFCAELDESSLIYLLKYMPAAVAGLKGSLPILSTTPFEDGRRFQDIEADVTLSFYQTLAMKIGENLEKLKTPIVTPDDDLGKEKTGEAAMRVVKG